MMNPSALAPKQRSREVVVHMDQRVATEENRMAGAAVVMSQMSQLDGMGDIDESDLSDALSEVGSRAEDTMMSVDDVTKAFSVHKPQQLEGPSTSMSVLGMCAPSAE